MNLFNSVVWILAAVFTLVCILIGVLETVCLVHEPKHKNTKSFTLVWFWATLNLCFVAIATSYCLLVAAEHNTLLAVAEVIMSFLVAALAIKKLGDYIEVKIDGVDFDLVMGRKKTS